METLTAAAIATLLITKIVEKLGEALGEKVPELSEKIWGKVAKLSSLLKRKSPETAAILETVENVPSLIESQPSVFSLPVLTEKMEQAAREDLEIAEIIDALAVEVEPYLTPAFQTKIVRQVALKGVRAENVKGNFSQEADAFAKDTSQEILVDVEIKGDIDLGSLSQKA